MAAAVWSPETGGSGVWIFDANGRESRRLTFPPEVHRRPVWSPDGTRLAFGRSKTIGEGPQLATLDLARNGTAEQFANGLPEEQARPIENLNALPTDWSRDGRFIAIDDGVGAEVQDVWIADVAGRKVVPLLQNKFQQWGAAFSPDGKRIGVCFRRIGPAGGLRPGIRFHAVATRTGERRQVSETEPGSCAGVAMGASYSTSVWTISCYAVSVKGPLEFGEAKPLFRIAGPPQYGTTRDFQFDVSSDGQRFVMPTTGSVPPPPVHGDRELAGQIPQVERTAEAKPELTEPKQVLASMRRLKSWGRGRLVGAGFFQRALPTSPSPRARSASPGSPPPRGCPRWSRWRPFRTWRPPRPPHPLRPIRSSVKTPVPWHFVHIRTTTSFPASSASGGPGALSSCALRRRPGARGELPRPASGRSRGGLAFPAPRGARTQ